MRDAVLWNNRFWFGIKRAALFCFGKIPGCQALVVHAEFRIINTLDVNSVRKLQQMLANGVRI